MSKMAGVMVGDNAWWLHLASCDLRLHQRLREIFYLTAESPRSFLPLRIMIQQPVIFLEGRAATCGVDDNGVEIELLKSFDVPSSTFARPFEVAAMRIKGAAA